MPIPSKDKNIYLLPLTDGGVTQPYNMPNSPSYNKNKAKHNGLDIGWTTGHAYWPILACQDGKVVDVYNNNSSIGNAVVLQHDYEDGTHSWTGYIHLKENPKVKKGQSIKMGEQIGIRGGSPYVNGKAKYGVHLHLYLTQPITKAYTWNTMKANVIDPLPHLYRSKEMTYDKLVGDLAKLPYIEDAIINVVKPVERDTNKDQLLETSSKLRVRMAPSLKGTIIGYLQPNAYYDYYDMKEADGYQWYQIEANQWVAKTSTMTIYPKVDGEALLKEEIKQLTEFVDNLTAQVNQLNTKIDKAKEVLNEN